MSKTHTKRRPSFAIDALRVELIAYNGPETQVSGRRESVRTILGLMFHNLQVRGRPKKIVKGGSDAA